MKKVSIILVACLSWIGGSSADVLVKIGDQPLVRAHREERSVTAPVGFLEDADLKSNEPSYYPWFIPFFEVDMSAPGDTTYFSVWSDCYRPVDVLVEYRDVYGNIQVTESLELAPHELRAVSVRDISGLAVDRDGYARGYIKIVPDCPVAVDIFQLETRNAFAVGGNAYDVDDSCRYWTARFLRFDAAGGTRLVFLATPMSADPSYPESVLGDVYDENGDFINSFEIHTDQGSFEISVQDVVHGGVQFGTVELVITPDLPFGGLVEVRHRALGEYSVGHPAICTD